MAKGIILVDIPTKCDDCYFRFQVNKNINICAASQEVIINLNEISYFCPIQELPHLKTLYNENGERKQPLYEFNNGWNTCLCEILKGE